MDSNKQFDLFGMPVFADVSNGRALALKVLEEASELCEAAKRYDKVPHDSGRIDMLDEFADVTQALQNFAECFEITRDEVYAALDRCVERNEGRGRY